ncbi:MAG: flagellar basal-body MS-ring/collar protein FliF [Kiloniellaceae bacterium]
MNSIADTLRNLGPARLGLMGAVAAGIIAFFIYLTSQLTTPDLALLYADLDPQDSGQIVSRLEQMEVRYRLGSDGTQIFVPSDQVARLRVAMAEDGLPSGGSIGYEIFDRSEGLGTTNFVQNINHVRALEGELARTIRSIGSIRQARVHLVLPRRELFTRDRQEPTASIVLALTGKQRLDRPRVLAIQHLVAAAVPGLKPNMISIIDSNGTLLARGTSDEDLQGTATTAEEMRIAYETRMVRTIEELIERSVGPGNVRAQVSAEMDFDRVTENAEIFDPDGQVVRSTQIIEEESGSLDGNGPPPVTIGGNLPEAALPAAEPNGSQTNATRNEETTNYEISRTVKTHVRETGTVRRLSVAVLVNGTTTQTSDGKTAYQPRNPQEMEQLAALVRSAVGFDEARGDVLEIVNLQFADLGQDLNEAGSGSLFGLDQAQLMRIAEVLVLGVVAVLVLLLVVRPLVGRVIEGGAEDGTGRLTDQSTTQAALAGPDQQDEGAGGLTNLEVVADEIEQMIDLNKVEGRVRASSVKKIGEIVDKHPEEAVAIIRNWLYQES